MTLFSKLYPNTQPETEPEPGLLFTTRFYPCDVCRAKTFWRDLSRGVHTPVCSDGCLAEVRSRVLPAPPTAELPDVPVSVDKETP